MRFRLIRQLALPALLLGASATTSRPLAAQHGPTNPQVEADMKEVLAYRITATSLAQIAKVQDNMLATLKANPGLAKKYAGEKMEGADENATLAETAKSFDKIPEMKQAIVKGGLTPRQYLVVSLAVMQAAMANAVMEMPGADKSQMSPTLQANAAFLKAHMAEVQRMQMRAQELDALTRKSRGEEPDEDAGEGSDSLRTRRR